MSAPHPWYGQSTAGDPAPHVTIDAKAQPAPRTPAERLLGGPPFAVFMRLFFVSLVVGALLMWLDIRPFEVFDALRRFVDRLWYFGWDSVRTVIDYVLAGALLVIPCWLLMRLMSYRGR